MVGFHVKRETGGFQFDLKGSLKPGINLLIGPSGSGKTSLIRDLMGMEPQFLLELEINGISLNPLYKNESLGYVPQGSAVSIRMSPWENIVLGRELDFEKLEFGKDLCKQLDLLDLDSRKPYYSSGERARIALVRALIAKPRFLFLDEPFSALDKKRKEVAKGLIQSINNNPTEFILIATHDEELFEGIFSNKLELD